MVALIVLIASVRPVRAGSAVGAWVAATVDGDDRFDLDLVDLAQLDLPMMNEPHHPRLGLYTYAHTKAWSARVGAADAFVFVTPEYNHSYAPSLKNAVDYLFAEWHGKPVAFVSYGGRAGGGNGVAAMRPVTAAVGLVDVSATVTIAGIGSRVQDGLFSPTPAEIDALAATLDELSSLAPVVTAERQGGARV